MSYVSIHTLSLSGDVDRVGEASNASAFHMSIWKTLGMRRHGWLDDYRWFSDSSGNGPLEKLWASIKTLPREEGLAMAATYDRCWFDWSLLDETIAALDAIDPFATTAGDVANILRELKKQTPARAFTFMSSLASSWRCQKADSYHDLDFDAGVCRTCGLADFESAGVIVHE